MIRCQHGVLNWRYKWAAGRGKFSILFRFGIFIIFLGGPIDLTPLIKILTMDGRMIYRLTGEKKILLVIIIFLSILVYLYYISRFLSIFHHYISRDTIITVRRDSILYLKSQFTQRAIIIHFKKLLAHCAPSGY